MTWRCRRSVHLRPNRHSKRVPSRDLDFLEHATGSAVYVSSRSISQQLGGLVFCFKPFPHLFLRISYLSGGWFSATLVLVCNQVWPKYLAPQRFDLCDTVFLLFFGRSLLCGSTDNKYANLLCCERAHISAFRLFFLCFVRFQIVGLLVAR